MIPGMFETASFHIVKPCNMACKFCYATFNDMNVKMIEPAYAMDIIYKLKSAGLQKITFAGGEPMLYPHLKRMIGFSRSIGLVTSIITNGSMLTIDWLVEMGKYLEWLGISIDSVDASTLQMIGRRPTPDYYRLIDMIKEVGFKLKINTVVNRYNKDESFRHFIEFADPDRWKVFQALRVEGQNHTQFDKIKVTRQEYLTYLSRNAHPSMVAEDNKAMTGSYLLIDPQGRLFENSQGKHTYSDPLQYSSVEKCLTQINLDRQNFLHRGGVYNW